MATGPDSQDVVEDGDGDDGQQGGEMEANGKPVGVHPDACRLVFRGATGVGFPRPAERLASTGTVRATVLFADFADVAADRTPQQLFDVLSPDAEDFFKAVSYGRLDLVLEPHLEWLHLSQNASVYGAGIATFVGHRTFIAEAMALADPAIDFSHTDLVVVMSTPNARAIPIGPTWMGVPGRALEADGNAILNGITSGADIQTWGGRWLNHEMGHSMSLPDLYRYNGNGGFTRPFSVMDLISSAAPEPLAWERWQLGWLDDEQVLCNPEPADIALSPIERQGGTKAVMVRTSDARVIAVESRRAIGYDARLQRVGAVVSVIDSSVQRGFGQIRVANQQQALLAGESTEVDGVTVTVIRSTDAGDVVRVSR